jgi:arsenate reductase (thioredoxin)
MTTIASDHPPIRVLFVCTGNSVRSLFGEVLLRRAGGPDFEVFSAGTHPSGVNPLTIRALDEAGLPHERLRSKSVDEYVGQSFDYVITVCDDARQTCPVFPGVREALHWGYSDPSSVEGDDEAKFAAFRATLTSMGERVSRFAMMTHRHA